MTAEMRQVYADAMRSQDACNLSGIVKSLARATSLIWEEVRADGGGTDDVNRHPVCRLYAEQIGFLSGMGMGDMDTYQAAYAACDERSQAAATELEAEPAPEIAEEVPA